MIARFGIPLIGTLVVGTLLSAGVSAQGPADTPPPPPTLPAPEGVEVLARGPVHEAYAEPTEVRPEASPLITKQPPEPINEWPPDQKPEGDNVQWIPGYWGWDQDQGDYLWVSGFWQHAASRPAVGARQLATGRGWLALGARILGFYGTRPAAISTPAATVDR